MILPMSIELCTTGRQKHLVIDCRLPTLADVVPAVEKYKFAKTNDEITHTKRPERVSRQLYTQVVAGASLRILHEIFQCDRHRLVSVVTLNAFVETIDDSTGQPVKPYILSVRTSDDEFKRLNLQNVEPVACLKGLSAAISRSPSELVPIKPIVDINMVDPRFIQEQDVLSSIDNRTNLMELTPSEFESLITNLFQKMGLETKLTIPSRDGGVDCVAFDQRPILGGKVVIQAKRYKHTVGVSSIRDLFGTMLNEGASKGILVTTSGYGKASFEFANGKPIELISGANLLYLLRKHAGVEAKIQPPEDWVDYREDSQ
jgi:restriction system protein